jgi:hypothetical protein
MGSTYTDNGGIEKIGLGEQAGAWGTTTNNNFDIVDRLINGVGSITLSGTTHTLTTSDGSLSDGMFKVLVLAGSPSGTNTITISPNNADKLYFVKNGTSQTATFTQGSGADVSVAAGKGAIIFADGAGSGAAVTDLTALFVNSQAIDGAVIGGTTPAAGTFTTVTANGGVTVDNINIDGTEIDLSSGDLTIDVAGDIDLDADGGNVKISDGGTQIGDFANSSSDFVISSSVNNKDIIFKGTDDSSGITALTLDMSEAGNATFNGTVTTTGLTLGSTAVTSTAAELNALDGITATVTELNHTDGVSSNIQTQLDTKHDAVGNGLQEDSATTVAMKNSFISNTSSAISTGTTTSFTASTYPTFISGATTSSGGGSFTVTVGGSANTLNMRDGDSGTFDTFATLLPAGATISGNQFQYLAIQLRPG